MAFFDRSDPAYLDRVDFQLMKENALPVVGKEHLEDVCLWLQQYNYQIYHFDCQQWLSLEVFYDDIGDKLKYAFAEGRNLKAFNDCLASLLIPFDRGLVFVFWHYDTFSIRHPEESYAILDSIRKRSRNALLYAQLFMTLVHLDDQEYRYHFPLLGGWPLRQPRLDHTDVRRC